MTLTVKILRDQIKALSQNCVEFNGLYFDLMVIYKTGFYFYLVVKHFKQFSS